MNFIFLSAKRKLLLSTVFIKFVLFRVFYGRFYDLLLLLALKMRLMLHSHFIQCFKIYFFVFPLKTLKIMFWSSLVWQWMNRSYWMRQSPCSTSAASAPGLLGLFQRQCCSCPPSVLCQAFYLRLPFQVKIPRANDFKWVNKIYYIKD